MAQTFPLTHSRPRPLGNKSEGLCCVPEWSSGEHWNKWGQEEKQEGQRRKIKDWEFNRAQERRLWTSKGDHHFELASQGTSQVPNEEPIHDSGKGCEEGIQVVVLFFHQLPEVTRCNRWHYVSVFVTQVAGETLFSPFWCVIRVFVEKTGSGVGEQRCSNQSTEGPFQKLGKGQPVLSLSWSILEYQSVWVPRPSDSGTYTGPSIPVPKALDWVYHRRFSL